MTATIDLCAGWNRIGEAPTATLEAVTRHLALGEWQMAGAVDALEFSSGRSITDVDTVRVVDGDRVVFSGLVAPVDAGGLGGLTITHDAEGERFEMVGPDAWGILASRLAYPTPTTGPPWADDHDVRTGVASTVAIEYLNANLGAGALADRVVPGTTLLDGLSGTSSTWSARLQRLDEWITSICVEGGITCRPTVGFNGGFVVYCGATRNRSTRIVLSDQGDLTSATATTTPPATTYVIAGGQGDLAARAFVAVGGGVGLARREAFSDRSATPTVDELRRIALADLAEGGARTSVLAQLSDAASQRLTFLADYDVGDTLAVQLGASRYPVVVASVAITISPERRVIRPVFNEVATNPLTRLIAAVGDLEATNRINIA